MNDDNRKIRIGSFDYPLPFLSNLIDSLRDEPQSFTGNLLRVWEDSELTRLQAIERNAELEYEARRIQENANQVELKERNTDD